MPRMSKKLKKELAFFLNDRGRRSYNGLCRKCPTLLICGKKDSANIKSAYYFHQNIQNAKLEIIENTGHVVNEENPLLLAQILNKYYNETK